MAGQPVHLPSASGWSRDVQLSIQRQDLIARPVAFAPEPEIDPRLADFELANGDVRQPLRQSWIDPELLFLSVGVESQYRSEEVKDASGSPGLWYVRAKILDRKVPSARVTPA